MSSASAVTGRMDGSGDRVNARAALLALRRWLDPVRSLRVLVHLSLGRSPSEALAAKDEAAPFEPSRSIDASAPLADEAALAASLVGPTSAWAVAAYLGAAYEEVLAESRARRTRGAHHTPPTLAREVVGLAMAARGSATSPGEPRRVCDPAVGSGVFLVEVLRLFAPGQEDVDAWIERGLFGVDVDAEALFLARVALFAVSSRTAGVTRALGEHLVRADFLELSDPRTAPPWLRDIDVFVGNPPWVAFKGRAAEKIDDARRAYLVASCSAFAGYPTLHGAFIERCARALAPRGRLGLVVPTSVADLDGYAPTRRAHDALCEVDAGLPDYGARAFDGVFQPAMALLSTRRAAPVMPGDATWELARADLDDTTRALLERAGAMPRWPSQLFGERGLQTSSADRAELARERTRRFTQPLLSGTEVRPFEVLDARTFVDPRVFADRLRTPEAWAEVKVLVRQTARFPIAALSPGLPFRNSVLAGFETREIAAHALVAFLNASPTRFLHYQRFRDARQGMPQLKIGHLRRTPMPGGSSALLAELARLGHALSRDPRAVDPAARLDRLVADALGMSARERERVEAWSRDAGKLPTPRARPAVSA